MADTEGTFMHPMIKAAWGGIAVSLAVAALKFAAWRSTGSVALYSDALECVINVAGACTALVALRISLRPADASHPYGHQKVEHLSAMAEGLMVLAASGAILHEVAVTWANPHPLSAPWQGLLLSGVATAMNAVWSWWLIRAGRRWQSPAVLASGRHLLTDVWTSGGVLAGFALVPATGWLHLDPAIAVPIALNIAWTGIGMIREAVDGLMDRADPKVLDRMKGVIAAHGTGALQAHDLRTRQYGPVTFAEFHLVVPAPMAVRAAHAICDRIEAAVQAEFGAAVVNIHVEPEEAAEADAIPVAA
jgi:cation diffusion facilitator family transporter